VFVQAMQAIGWQVPTPKATLYAWAKLPAACQQSSIPFCVDLVTNTGVAASPGAGFGSAGEGYVRFALVQAPEILQEACDRMAEYLPLKRGKISL
jgi:aspartate/methionine/tyrosine aminotransferase